LKGSGLCEEITVLRDFGGRPDVAFGLHADVLDRWSKEGDMLRQAYRPILCVLSVLIAALIVGASGGLQPAHRLFAQSEKGVLVTFVILYTAAMIVSLNSRLRDSIWMIPIGGALGYLIGDFAYFVYFGIFDGSRLLNSLRNTDLINVFYLLVFAPVIALTLLIGLLSGTIFYVSVRCFRRFADHENGP
jgi:hypothetical protein